MTSPTSGQKGLVASLEEAGERRARQTAQRRHLRWKGDQLFYGGLRVGEVVLWQSVPQLGRWRAWVMTDASGAHHGWFATEQEARRQVELVVAAAAAEPPR